MITCHYLGRTMASMPFILNLAGFPSSFLIRPQSGWALPLVWMKTARLSWGTHLTSCLVSDVFHLAQVFLIYFVVFMVCGLESLLHSVLPASPLILSAFLSPQITPRFPVSRFRQLSFCSVAFVLVCCWLPKLFFQNVKILGYCTNVFPFDIDVTCHPRPPPHLLVYIYFFSI